MKLSPSGSPSRPGGDTRSAPRQGSKSSHVERLVLEFLQPRARHPSSNDLPLEPCRADFEQVKAVGQVTLCQPQSLVRTKPQAPQARSIRESDWAQLLVTSVLRTTITDQSISRLIFADCRSSRRPPGLGSIRRERAA